MARKVKLFDTGEIVEKSPTLYYAPNKRWFSSYDAYLIYDLDNQLRTKCIDKMYELMGYETTQTINTRFFKRFKEWHEGYDYKTILKAMELATIPIEFAFRFKSFESENAKLFYAIAIINNQLNDALKIIDNEAKAKIKEKNLEIFADDVDVLQNVCTSAKSKDVSSLLGDING